MDDPSPFYEAAVGRAEYQRKERIESAKRRHDWDVETARRRLRHVEGELASIVAEIEREYQLALAVAAVEERQRTERLCFRS